MRVLKFHHSFINKTITSRALKQAVQLLIILLDIPIKTELNYTTL